MQSKETQLEIKLNFKSNEKFESTSIVNSITFYQALQCFAEMIKRNNFNFECQFLHRTYNNN